MSIPYIEISPRASGKTYRLINDVAHFLKWHYEGRVAIYCQGERAANFISDRLAKCGCGYASDRVVFNQPVAKKYPYISKTYVDEFDYLENPPEDADYYATSPSKIRTIEDFKHPENDFLLRLLRRAGGQYVSNVGMFNHMLLDVIAEASVCTNNDTIQREYNNTWYDLTKR